MADAPEQPPVLGFIAYSGTGKTTLLTRLIPALGNLGIQVGLIKHAHHGFDPDVPGKDSYRLRQAGAVQTLVASPKRRALITELDEEQKPELGELLDALDSRRLDLVLVEGFRGEAIPKIEVYRPGLGQPLHHGKIPNIIAVVSDAPQAMAIEDTPVLDLNQPDTIAAFIADNLRSGTLISPADSASTP